jgi:hypothetical protein
VGPVRLRRGRRTGWRCADHDHYTRSAAAVRQRCHLGGCCHIEHRLGDVDRRYPTWRDLYGFTVFSYSDLVVAQASWTTTVAAYADWNALIGIISPPTGVTGYLLDESGNILTDESGNRLTAP